MVEEGYAGGKAAARRLRLVVEKYLPSQAILMPDDRVLMIYVYGDIKDLAGRYSHLLVDAGHLERFCKGFNDVDLLTLFENVEDSYRSRLHGIVPPWA